MNLSDTLFTEHVIKTLEPHKVPITPGNLRARTEAHCGDGTQFDRGLWRASADTCCLERGQMESVRKVIEGAHRKLVEERILERRAFGFANDEASDVGKMTVLLPGELLHTMQTYVGAAVRSIESDPSDMVVIQMDTKAHPVLLTCLRGEFWMKGDEKNPPQELKFTHHANGNVAHFSVPQDLVISVMAQEAAWVNPLFAPDGARRQEPQIRNIAALCGLSIKELKTLLGARNTLQNRIDRFGRYWEKLDVSIC